MESSDAGKRSSDIAGLLFKAVKGLPDEEQRAVFEYFFERGIGIAQPASFGPFLQEGAQLRGADLRATIGSGAWPDPSALTTLFTAQKPMGPQQTMIPVRLSEAQHQRLKRWCAEHNFPMAVVVRGLIERFLDSWEKRAA
jgi:hypothetical protein